VLCDHKSVLALHFPPGCYHWSSRKVGGIATPVARRTLILDEEIGDTSIFERNQERLNNARVARFSRVISERLSLMRSKISALRRNCFRAPSPLTFPKPILCALSQSSYHPKGPHFRATTHGDSRYADGLKGDPLHAATTHQMGPF
jgi:hypothetical protein